MKTIDTMLTAINALEAANNAQSESNRTNIAALITIGNVFGSAIDEMERLRAQNKELVEALEASRRWLNGDKWRNSDNRPERECWEKFTAMLDALISRAKEVEVP